MLCEILLLGTTIAVASAVLTGCSTKKQEIPPAPVAPAATPPANEAETTSTTGTSTGTTAGATSRVTVRGGTTTKKAPTTRANVNETEKKPVVEPEKRKNQKVNPVFGTIEPNMVTDVVVTHKPSTKREDKLVIVSSEMLGKEMEMAKTFKQIKNTGNDITVKLFSV
uniref:MSP domain-containing protein n=1 Tax=Caenorhabditis tropicalis TaxID=1561998 RepID=A0A1I7TM09_9PELO